MAGDLPAASISKWTGLYRSVDPFAIASGPFEVADNVVVPGPSLLRPRRGFRGLLTGPIETLGDYAGAVMAYGAGALRSVSLGTNAASTITRGASDLSLPPALLSGYNGGTKYQTKARFLGANGNFYQSTNFGLARVASGTGTWTPAGMQVPVPGVVWGTTTGTFLPALGSTVNGVSYPNGSQVAYRLTFIYEDPSGDKHESAPSDRIVVYNTSGSAKGVAWHVFPSAMVPVGTRVRLWRTRTAVTPSDSSDVAGDEMFLIAESALNASAGADGYLAPVASTQWAQGTDNTPDVPFLVEPLYTNPTTGDVNGLGIGNANTPPPAAADVFTFKGRTYFCNTEEVQRLTIQIIGSGAGGIVDGDTLFINGRGFQWVGGVGPAAPGFERILLWYTGGVRDAGSITGNLAQNAAAAVVAINSVFGPYGVFAGEITSAPALSDQIFASPAIVNALPGYVNLQRLVPGAAPISVVPGVGAGEGWAGALANGTSDSNRQPANLMQSQPDDPESVPPAFTQTVGRLERPILRGIGLRDSAFIFKGAGDGLWKFTDDGTGSLVIGPLDQTVNLIAPETVRLLENAAYCLTDKGVTRITDGGAPAVISTDKIQDDLSALVARVGPDTLARLAFAVAYESERLYVLALPESPNATSCTVQFIYNLQTDAWTRWTLPTLTCGSVDPATDLLVLGRDTSVAGGSALWVERKALDDSDFQDPGFSSTVPGAGTYTASSLVFSGDLTGSYAPGDLIRYSPDSSHAYLLRVLSATWAVGPNQTTVTLDASATWTAGGSFDVLKGIQATLELLPLAEGEPLFEKQWQKVYFFFRRAAFESGSLSFSTEKQQNPVTYTLSGPVGAPWMYDALGFGLTPWGGTAQNVVLTLALDQAAARSAALTLRIRIGDALAGWELSALRIPYVPTTPRTRQ